MFYTSLQSLMNMKEKLFKQQKKKKGLHETSKSVLQIQVSANYTTFVWFEDSIQPIFHTHVS